MNEIHGGSSNGVGYIRGLLEGIQRQITEHSDTANRNFAALTKQVGDHSEKDDANFREVFQRLKPLEERDAAQTAVDARLHDENSKHHGWVQTWMHVLAQIVTPLIAAALALGGHIFFQRFG